MNRTTAALAILALSVALLSGCLLRPFSGGANVTPGPAQPGCANNNPACGENYSCVGNSCVLKSGCAYGNPPCDASRNESCIGNACVAAQPGSGNQSPAPGPATGCEYGNPACDSDYQCVNNTCVEKLICGKFGCQQGEDSASCCADCGCAQGYSCTGSGCVRPASGTGLSVENVTVAPLSPVVLYAVPSRTVEKGAGPAIQVLLKNNENEMIYGIKARPEVQGYTGVSVHDAGSVGAGETLPFNYTPMFNSKALGGNTSAVFRLRLDYYGGTRNSSTNYAAEIPLFPINYFNWKVPEAAAAWADSDDPAVRDMALDATLGAVPATDREKERAARQIFGHIQARSVQVRNPSGAGPCYSDTVAFPADVLKSRSGDCAELAFLFAASMEAAGMESAIIKTPDTVLAAYAKLDGSLVPADLRALDGSDFASAVANGEAEYSRYPSGSVVVWLEDQWAYGVKKVAPGTLAPSSSIVTEKQDCEFLSGEFNVNYLFRNNGYDAGRRCVNATLYEGGKSYLSRRECVDVYVNDRKGVSFVLTGIPTNITLNAECWLD